MKTNRAALNTTFFFSTVSYLKVLLPSYSALAMAFDFLILLLTAFALLGRHSARTDLWRLLFKDGLVYFLVSFSTNCIPAVGITGPPHYSYFPDENYPWSGSQCVEP